MVQNRILLYQYSTFVSLFSFDGYLCYRHFEAIINKTATSIVMSFCEHKHLFLLVMYIMEFLDHRTSRCLLNFERNCQFANVVAQFYTLTRTYKNSCCSICLPAFGMVNLLSLATLVGMQWRLIEVLICIFLMTEDVEYLFSMLIIQVSFFVCEVTAPVLRFS